MTGQVSLKEGNSLLEAEMSKCFHVAEKRSHDKQYCLPQWKL